jgi:hypothetical protein
MHRLISRTKQLSYKCTNWNGHDRIEEKRNMRIFKSRREKNNDRPFNGSVQEEMRFQNVQI